MQWTKLSAVSVSCKYVVKYLEIIKRFGLCAIANALTRVLVGSVSEYDIINGVKIV